MMKPHYFEVFISKTILYSYHKWIPLLYKMIKLEIDRMTILRNTELSEKLAYLNKEILTKTKMEDAK